MKIYHLFAPLQKRFQLSVWLTLLLMWALSALGQNENLRFTNYTINNGLSENLVYSITQDSQGFMWFGTQDGLDRFNGYDFTTFRHDPFDSGSLSDNTIISLYGDSKGRLWIGTAHGGLNLFYPEHNQFIHFLTYHSDSTSVSGDYIESITEDKKGNLWVGTFGNGIFELVFPENHSGNQPERIVHFVHNPNDSTSLGNNYVISLYADIQDKLWVSCYSGNMQTVDLSQKTLQFFTPGFTIMTPKKIITKDGLQFDLKNSEWIRKTPLGGGQVCFWEKNHELWLGTGNGLYLNQRKNNTLVKFDMSQPSAPQGSVLSICNAPGRKDASNSLWLGSYYGLMNFDTKNLVMHLLRNDPLNKESIVGGRILNIYKDRSGCMWLGSNGNGMSKYDYHSSLFSSPEYATTNNKTKTADLSILSFYETKNYLLLGAFSGLWKIDKRRGNLSEVTIERTDTKNKSEFEFTWPQLIFEIIPADSTKLWLACSSGLFYYNPENNKLTLYSPDILTGETSDNAISGMYDDHEGNLWLLTRHTFSKFNIKNKTFTNYYYNNKIANNANDLPHGNIYRDSSGNFWLGGNLGLLYFNTAKKTFTHFTNHPKDTASLSFNRVECIIPDPKQPDKYIWIGTAGGGLNQLNLQTKKFTHFTMKDGLSNNYIHGIVSDRNGKLWISTNKGISKFDPVEKTFQDYDIRQGLPSNEFNPGAYYKNEEGKLFFGSINGFVAFNPDSVRQEYYAPQVVFTDFRLFNKSVSWQDKNSPLKQSITEAKRIDLSYKDNTFSFQIAALNYSNTDQTQYTYRLKNFNKSWINIGTNRLITFSNLSPGHYSLEVKSANSGGVWSDKIASIEIVILPPWWKTWWAYLLYTVLFAIAIMLIRREELRRLKLQNRVELGQLEAAKLKEMDHLKSRFFANISHEFRTPLTLIIGPLEDFLKDRDIKKFTAIFPEMYRNSKRLLQLINQLLDLSRLDTQHYHIHAEKEGIIYFVKQIVHSFSSLAHRKNIELETEIDPRLREKLEDGTIHFYFDEDIIEKILTNLLSNAFKFTADKGNIRVSLILSDKEEGFMEMKVEDTGTGIPAEKLPFIFDRFYQADDSNVRQYEGSGIGLALVKELVELHEGKIVASSLLRKGTAISCFLPLDKKLTDSSTRPVLENVSNHQPSEIIGEKEDSEPDNDLNKENGLPIVLLVEDQPDMRKYISEKIADEYHIIEARDGKVGLEKAFEEIPDLVISDVMMPVMDGFELCKQLKTDQRTSHIPVILLTARAEDADKLAGLETGADAYLIKPFNSKELLLRVHNLIELRNKLRKKFSGKLLVKPSEITVTSQDSQFMQRLLETVESHIDDEKFSIEALGLEFGMSSSQINRKLKAIVNQSAGAFIRSVRMERAMKLLKKNQATIAEVAYETGFSEPSYFSRVFKSYFGFPPSDVNS